MARASWMNTSSSVALAMPQSSTVTCCLAADIASNTAAGTMCGGGGGVPDQWWGSGLAGLVGKLLHISTHGVAAHIGSPSTGSQNPTPAAPRLALCPAPARLPHLAA